MHTKSLFRIAPAVALLSLAMTPGATGAPATPAAQSAPAVQPEAIAALNKMGAYLRTLTSFEVNLDTTSDSVLDNDQKVQLMGKATFKVRRPNAFLITIASDRKSREFYYDGKSFTIFAPRMGLYSTVAAPATIHEVFDTLDKKFNIQVPLEDLFHWGMPDDKHNITSAGAVGYSTVNGQAADQYAFREGDIDWQVWVARGSKPLPLKIVIDKRSDDANPEYSAVLHWNTEASFPDKTFVFVQPPNAKSIKLLAANQ